MEKIIETEIVQIGVKTVRGWLAMWHPERITAIISQNGNMYEEYHFESLYSKGVLSARRLKNLLKKDGLGKSISSDI